MPIVLALMFAAAPLTEAPAPELTESVLAEEEPTALNCFSGPALIGGVLGAVLGAPVGAGVGFFIGLPTNDAAGVPPDELIFAVLGVPVGLIAGGIGGGLVGAVLAEEPSEEKPEPEPVAMGF